MKVPSRCTECGSISMSWQAINTATPSVQTGRLRVIEVQCQFVLGCDICSETLKVISTDAVANWLNKQEQSK